MDKQLIIIIILTFGLSFFCSAQKITNKQNSTEPFAAADIRFEQNATDGDIEVVFEIKGGDEGLTDLTIISPDERTIVNASSPDVSTLGIRQFRFESPEPKDVEGLKAAYPEGTYKFSGSNTDGVKYYSESILNHKLPSTVSFIVPGEEEENINTENLTITWTRVDDLAAYKIEIDQEELGVNMLVKLPGSANKFSVPIGFLQPETEYTLSIGTVTKEGNISVVETTFTTAGEE